MIRALARIAAAVLIVSIGLVFVARNAPTVVLAADLGVTELYIDLASHGRLLVGPYSRFGWHHPGPLYFYLQMPLYVASNHAGASLNAGAIAINVLAFAVLLWTISREQRRVLAVAVGVACLAFAFRVPRLLASPWTPHVTILPTLACLALAAAVASGRTELLAATAFAASFVAQTDVALVPPIAVVVLLTVGAVVQRGVRETAPPVRHVVLAVCVCVAAWALPMVEAVRHHGGNLAALVHFFTEPNVRLHSTREALGAWSDNVSAMARADVALAWGNPVRSAGATWTSPAAGALMASLALTIYVAVRKRRVFDAWFGMMVLAAALASLWSLTRVRDEIVDHEVFWLVALGSVAAAIIVATVVSSRTPVIERLAPGALGALVPVALIIAALDFRNIVEFERDRAEQRDVPLAVAAIEGYLEREHSRSAILDVDAAWSQGVPIVLRLRQHHRRVAVSRSSLFMFTDAFAPTGREDTSVRVEPGLHGPPDQDWEQIFDSYWANVYVR